MARSGDLLLSRKYRKDVDKFLIYRLIHLDGPGDRHINYLIVLDADHNIALTFHQGFDTCHAESAGEYAVHGRWCASALQVAEYGHPHVVLRILLAYALCIVHCASVLLGYEHDAAVLALAYSAPDKGCQLVDVGLVLRNDGCFRSGGYCTVLGEEACVPAHNLDEEDAVVARCRIPDLVDTFHNGIQRRVVANGRIGAIEVVVNRARKADYSHIMLTCKQLGSCQRTVASNDHERIYAELLDIGIGLRPTFRRAEFLAPCGLEYGAAALYRVAYALSRKFLYITGDETFPSPVDAVDLRKSLPW